MNWSPYWRKEYGASSDARSSIGRRVGPVVLVPRTQPTRAVHGRLDVADHVRVRRTEYPLEDLVRPGDGVGAAARRCWCCEALPPQNTNPHRYPGSDGPSGR